MSTELVQYINKRKEELDAVILAHFYQLPEIQDLADIVGDSLQLAREASKTSASVIVSCGVRFMAETAKILNPDKKVLLPAVEAGCAMADMVTAEALREKKRQYPQAVVVSYVNTSAEVKAESDICCTSANAIEVIKSIPEDRPILFVPDRNLGKWIEAQTNREMFFWAGCCPVHDQVTIEQVREQQRLYPDAPLVVHPECPPEITSAADAVRSTSGMLKYIQESSARDFIVGTEEGFLYTLENNTSGKRFHLARTDFICQDMKYITLERLAKSMKEEKDLVEIPEEIRERAYQALDRMLQIG